MINFYLTKAYVLDNFSAHQIRYQGEIYPTCEHLYHSLKFTNPTIQSKIILTSSPLGAKLLAKDLKSERLKNWSNLKLEKMKMILSLKLKQHPEVRQFLASTQNQELIENSPNDYFGE